MASPAAGGLQDHEPRGDGEGHAIAPPGHSSLTYIGHATVLIELSGVRLLTDPLLGAGILHVRRRVPVPRLEHLRDLDGVLISHAHHDHFDPASLKRLGGAQPVVVPRGCGAMAHDAGLPDAIEVAEGDRIVLRGVTVEAVRAAHDGRRHPIGRSVAALGYLIEGSWRVYFAGDTDLFAGMSALAGRVDVALVPIWGWGPRVPAGHLDPVRAAEAVARIGPGIAVPIHWGTLRAWGTQRRLDPVAPARRFAHEVARAAPATVVRILMPGQRMALGSERRAGQGE